MASRNSTGNLISNRVVALQSQSPASDDFFPATVLNSLADIPLSCGTISMYRIHRVIQENREDGNPPVRLAGIEKADKERNTTTAGAEDEQE
jgi:hypothetical protein